MYFVLFVPSTCIDLSSRKWILRDKNVNNKKPIFVSDIPELRIEPQEVSIGQSESFESVCKSKFPRNNLTIGWKTKHLYSETSTSMNKITNGVILSLRNATVNDSGWIACVGENSIIRSTKNLHLTIKGISQCYNQNLIWKTNCLKI